MYSCPYLSIDFEGECDCEADTVLDCDQCCYGHGRKNPLAECNQKEKKEKVKKKINKITKERV